MSSSRSSFAALLEELRAYKYPQAYPFFEALVIALLRARVEAEGKRIGYPSGTPGRASRYEFDAFLPDGIGDFVGPTAVEIKLFLGRSPWRTRIGEALARLSMNAARHGGIEVGLLVHTAELGAREVADISRFAQQLPESPRMVVWGPQELQRLIDAHPDILETALQQRTLLPLREEFRQPEADWHERSRVQQEQLRATFQGEGITLVLGAGVSSSAGLPAWDGLLGSLYVALVAQELGGSAGDDKDLLLIARAAQALSGGSPLLSARYIRKGLEHGAIHDARPFHAELTKALYSSVHDAAPSPLVAAIARICQPTRTGAKVRAVVTYNFDDLLEEELGRAGVTFRSIYSGGDHPTPEELPIYHVHGFLPRDADSFPDLDKSLLAFSEEGYHELFRDPYHWTNIVQLNAFRESTCVLIGLSMTDPNLRRLLEYAAGGDDKPRHAAFLRRHSLEELRAQAMKVAGRDARVDVRAGEAFLRAHHSLEERVHRELGVEALWIDDYDDIPQALLKLL